MKALSFTFVATFILAVSPNISTAAPVVPGLSNKHPLSVHQVGNLLIGELRCLACHNRKGVPVSLERTAPDLSDVGSRLAPDFLQRFIASPSAVHAGTTMPDMLIAKTQDERNKIAEAITHFLIAQSKREFRREKIGEKEATTGKALFHTVGCIACHSPRDENGKEVTREGVVRLAHIPEKYSVSSLGEFLFQPLKVRPSGRMPDMTLTAVEAKAIASYLLGKSRARSKTLSPRNHLVPLGKKYFQEYNCTACHKLGNIPAAVPISDLQDCNLERGCLSKAPGKSPRFHLRDDQRKAIRTALAKRSAPISDKMFLATTLTAFNCIACHTRDNFGGISQKRNLLFQTDAKNLGDEARIPPPLTLVGAKLKPVWMKKVLFDGASVRPYMFTRMPQYGETNLGHLPGLFSRLDKVESFKFSLPKSGRLNRKERERAKELREAGRKLLGDKSLSCIVCHTYNGKTQQYNGVELMTTHERLQPSWFYHYLRNPNAFRPRTVMPTSWPGGTAVDKKVLHGDTNQQIEAIWYFLSLGRSAPNPSGVRNIETKLMVTNTTRTYRGRSRVAGFRGIAIGFPQKLSYAFNAETGTLSAIWRGDFVRVNRGGQGSGSFHPASRHVSLAQDVSFYRLPNEKTRWPLRPVMTKEKPVNPDPLYPKNRGYQFKGYYMDDASIPTFMYRSGDIKIEDRSTADTTREMGRLIRTLTFNSPKAETIWFRALTGKIESESKQRFNNSKLQLRIPSVLTVVRPTSTDKTVSELLLKLELPQGQTKLSFTYELLK